MKRLRGGLSLALAVAGALTAFGLLSPQRVQAAAPAPENPKSNSVGLQGTVPSKPPTQAATITTPSGGQSFTKTPVSINGLCPKGLLVKIFANNVFVGSALCESGSYSLQIDLFDGRNDIVARVFDALDQPGPDSNIVTVTFVNNQFNDTGVPLLTLTSNYARRGANPGELLTWPIIMSGGTSPYAVSVDWGDNKPATLRSEPFAGVFTISHIYDTAGVYSIVVKATDKNGVSAYLQLVGEANGAVTQGSVAGGNGTDNTQKKAIVSAPWWPAASSVGFSAVAFWLGRRYELSALRRHLENLE